MAKEKKAEAPVVEPTEGTQVSVETPVAESHEVGKPKNVTQMPDGTVITDY